MPCLPQKDAGHLAGNEGHGRKTQSPKQNAFGFSLEPRDEETLNRLDETQGEGAL